jgi:hypothetical protein
MSDDFPALADKISRLSPSHKLRLAADLLDNDRAQLAHSIAEQAALQIGAELAAQRTRKAGP